jgi:hypothetical protein
MQGGGTIQPTQLYATLAPTLVVLIAFMSFKQAWTNFKNDNRQTKQQTERTPKYRTTHSWTGARTFLQSATGQWTTLLKQNTSWVTHFPCFYMYMNTPQRSFNYGNLHCPRENLRFGPRFEPGISKFEARVSTVQTRRSVHHLEFKFLGPYKERALHQQNDVN